MIPALLVPSVRPKAGIAGVVSGRVGTTSQLSFRVYLIGGGFTTQSSGVAWSSTNGSVATVSQTGLVTFAGVGSCNIVASYLGATYATAVTATPAGVTDSFNRADNASLLGVADTGQTWIAGRGTWGIVSNTAYCSVVGSPPSNSAYISSTFSDCTVQVTTATIGPDNGIIVRVTDNANYIRIIFESGTWYLQSFITNSQSTLTSAGGTNANGDVLKVVTLGTNITAFLNGSQILTATSSFNQTATMHGLTTSDTQPRFDNFSIMP